jgi:hypothetical protein
MYIVRANPGGDEYAPNNQTTPCSNKPCQNDGLCVVVSNTSYNCLCKPGWKGEQYLKFE